MDLARGVRRIKMRHKKHDEEHDEELGLDASDDKGTEQFELKSL